jgi:RNAse (barnase) inhibitor barstar
MSELSNIPAQAVLPLGAYNADNLRREAERHDHTLLECDLSQASDKPHVMEAIGKAFGFGKHYGKNLDALFDCLTDVKIKAGSAGFLVMLQNVPGNGKFTRDERDALLDVFRDAADFFYEKDIAFRVFYSVAGAKAAS